MKLESPDVDDISFCIVEDFGPFGTPYLFVLMRQGLYVASLATGSVLLDFKKHLSIITADVKLTQQVVANCILNILDRSIFVTSQESNGVYAFSIEDSNLDSARNAALLQATEYKRLFAI